MADTDTSLLRIFPSSGAPTYDSLDGTNTPRNIVHVQGSASGVVVCNSYDGALILEAGAKDRYEMTLGTEGTGSFSVILPNAAYRPGGLFGVRVEDSRSPDNYAMDYTDFTPYRVGPGRFRLWSRTAGALANDAMPNLFCVRIDRRMDIGIIPTLAVRAIGDAMVLLADGSRVKTAEVPLDTKDFALFGIVAAVAGPMRLYLSLPASPDGDLMTLYADFRKAVTS